MQERQECHYETRCNGDLKLTVVFTTFGKVQNLEKGQPVSLPEDQKVPIPPQARGPLSNRKKPCFGQVFPELIAIGWHEIFNSS